ncbi:MAG: protein adenylyltransferase SelO family protein, partial [Burkholderiales bacterium]
MTIFFRRLAELGASPKDVTADRATMAEAFYREDLRETHQAACDTWIERYRQRIAEDDFAQSDRAARMARFNPKYVLRNYLAQEAIDLATAGDNSMVLELLDVMRRPYIEQPGRERFAEKRPDWARQKAGCSMLSCSS